MNQENANNLAMGMVERAAMSEKTKDLTYSAVAWFIWELYTKEGYEIVPRRMPTITAGELARMKAEEVVY